MKRKSNKKAVLERFKAAFKQSAEILDEGLKETISTPRYWQGFEDSVTYRQNGEVVKGANRNIVDLSNLKDSQKLEFTEDKAHISWDGNGVTPVVPVFFGHRTEKGFVPGRNWVDPTLQEIDLAKLVKDKFDEQSTN